MKKELENYSFDTLIDRRGTDCSKWDEYPGGVHAPDMLPMWTADMDFACPPAIIHAMQERLEHPIFGYYSMPARYWKAIINWQRDRFGATVEKKDIFPVASVLGGVAMAIQAFTEKGDAVLVPTPGYHAFFQAIENNERKLVTSPLIRDGDSFYMDYVHMEEQIRINKVKMFILCSPHNPTGRVWTEEELSRLIDLCSKYSVSLISDEIHADMTLTRDFIPIHKVDNPHVNDVAAALYAPTKTFNIAGLCTAYAVIKSTERMQRFQKAVLASGLKVKNTLGIEALMAGYESCASWVDDLHRYMLLNAEYAVHYIRDNIPQLHAYIPEATYFLWIDFQKTGMDMDTFYRVLLETAHVVVTRGDEFLDGGQYCVRMVCACPRTRLMDALERIKNIF